MKVRSFTNSNEYQEFYQIRISLVGKLGDRKLLWQSGNVSNNQANVTILDTSPENWEDHRQGFDTEHFYFPSPLL